jgi:hypothetical protein
MGSLVGPTNSPANSGILPEEAEKAFAAVASKD